MLEWATGAETVERDGVDALCGAFSAAHCSRMRRKCLIVPDEHEGVWTNERRGGSNETQSDHQVGSMASMKAEASLAAVALLLINIVATAEFKGAPCA